MGVEKSGTNQALHTEHPATGTSCASAKQPLEQSSTATLAAGAQRRHSCVHSIMSGIQDPFYVVKEEVTQAFQGINALWERWKDLLETTNTATNEEFKWTTNELKTGLKSIEYDITDLEETISIVENNRAKFKIDPQEIDFRKRFVTDIKAKVNGIKDELNSQRAKGIMEQHQRNLLMTQKQQKGAGGAGGKGDKYSRLESAIVEDNEEFIRGQQQRQEQIIRDQDKDLEQLGRTVGTLKEIGTTIDSTLKEHDKLIEEIDTEADRANAGLRGALKKLNDLIDSTNDRTQFCIIIILILALVGLIVAVIYMP